MTHRAEINFVRGKHQKAILERDNVVGMGVGYKVHRGKTTDELCVVVLVTKKLPHQALSPAAIVPHSLDGVKTDIIEVGEVKALQARTDRWRPAPGGVSIGHYKITAGTFGVTVRDRGTDQRLILSNNHVLANSNQAEKGDAILQPGAADGGQLDADVVAHLERFHPIQFNVEPPNCSIANGVAAFLNWLAALLRSKHRLFALQQNPQAVNQIDAAVAKPVDGIEISDEILDIGVIGGTTPATLGMQVRKSGRSTGFTSGQITVMDATVDVSYGGSNVARFENQLLSTPMSAPGDSGSLLVAEGSLLAVGLLFAGSEKVTIYNPIENVLSTLGIYL